MFEHLSNGGIAMTKFLLALALVAPAAFAAPVNFKLDEGHASIVFKANHLGFSDVYGMFGASEGKITWDADKPEASTVEIKVKTDSINTLNAKRDEHLKGNDFFNAKQFPEIILKSKSIKKAGKDKFEVKADLTMHGVTKPITFTFNHMKTGEDPWKNTRMGGVTSFKVKRSEFGMTYMAKPGEIFDEIEIVVSVEGTKI